VPLWINFNILLFSGYTLFGISSFFWPTLLNNIWFILLHLATLIINSIIVYGLVMRRLRINYLISIVSFLMIIHLFIFIFEPLSMELAYIGPGRSFYTLLSIALSIIVGERFIYRSLLLFNLTMVLVHVINLCYFTRRKVAEMFRG
jgi:hypothetical protein